MSAAKQAPRHLKCDKESPAGGPTNELRNLIDDYRHGMATANDLDTALDSLEASLNIPKTMATSALADGERLTDERIAHFAGSRGDAE